MGVVVVVLVKVVSVVCHNISQVRRALADIQKSWYVVSQIRPLKFSCFIF